ncbi:DNA-binding GntR family transcriptional regulator [Sporomusaceae bacterium BoRhaA]|uniref:GntR family transcriptional regulator n=1 Tax=Pelorhabdus rhamnosifermentans TaxID=2772457 RepID=UPI001C063762|nr:GntR family transcriptional regulator [Pelorhabdus rhamnosifermentans]MBU2700860.1 DNA-binding GntR family transcriptional regulator [Pelorhabdus rhamnosifermentans]
MDVDMIEPVAHESTREYVYRVLKANIMQLKLLPGSALSEKDIAVLLNVSRTPVREAFIRLSQEYLLDVVPQKGTYVSLIDLEHVKESKFLRETVEKEVIKLACKEFPSDQLVKLQACLALQKECIEDQNPLKFFELDDALHSTIFEGCKKTRVWSVIQQLHTHYNRVRMLNVANGHDMPRIWQQHSELIRAIQEQDVQLGSEMIYLHINKVTFDLNELLKDYPDYFKQKKLVEKI